MTLPIAHGLVGRADLPLPETLVLLAAAGVLVVSFAALALLWQRPRLEQPVERPLFRVPAAVDVLLGAFGTVIFFAVVYAGFAGTSATRANLAPTAVFIAMWVGVPMFSLLFGDVWRLVSPWRAVGRAVGWVFRRLDPPEPLPYPARIGVWPAAAGIVAFGWVELIWPRRDDPAALAVLALLYFAAMLVGQALYGVEQWSRRADPLGVYFGLFARLAPLARRDGLLVARVPLAALARRDGPAGTIALVCGGIGVTAFDGLQEGRPFLSIVDDLQRFFHSLGFNLGDALVAAFTVGLLGSVFAVAGLYRLGTEGIGRRDAPRVFVHTLMPILVAYVVAHYFSSLAYEGQSIAYLASDPLGNGSDLFGTAGATIDYGWISATSIRYVQVGALVLGHVAGLLLAHDRALALAGDAKHATRSQLVMLTVMVSFTCLGLWLLSEANG